MIRGRRLGFLYYILNEDSNSLVNRFFHCQFKNRTKKDWVSTILEDLKYLDLSDLSMETIKNMKKSEFVNILKQKIQEKSFEKLEKTKKSHTKVEHVEHNGIIMQKYLQPNKTFITKDESQFIFKLRCRM